MGKLFFYSDQIVESPGNRRLDHILLEGADLQNTKIGYIPSTEDEEKTHFNVKAQYYRNYGIQDCVFFDLYSEFDSSNIDKLLQCDIIHLSAGNPIEFQKAIKHRKMEQVLCDYFHQGGIIVGVSGGAVQLGNSIKLFQLFSGDSSEVLEGLQLVDFDFLPHYNRWDEDFKRDVESYAEKAGTTVYAGNDGDGMIVENGKIEMIGDIVVINGQ
ncbi:Type 1 glutamine amidotransferase-like domain-containing protein [Planococcus shixiaomingii]|uniref:Type 1 glutamine amidotransferase-like domain-containing protein n=1 Tax=Planococcus shixiaomingii TaxID=3058393 RepID=UPI00260F245D|nr:Type 1 glutamine amidotransferase-like domain-containing protein [Planococcus sp. N022]WKA55570.1 Type 1 glutamine amidotransferase-like domain-containing protein [Planococcus sp. N022]